ncbi:serine hydrolase domain-containing protein [Paenibacillus camelliae]|uniref:serine hydrolase domain-containing protein n=1 Tax=Paenibacillus camelliae TaxID=512410 RepID=UPI00203C6A9D|nr:serine hydrolase domain-containing protein [Paenibacillus camelliae]MCM3634217.1 beta-lactamase family protein [Paenibacillus camelliae]
MSSFKHLEELLSGFVQKDIAGCGCVVTHHGNIVFEGYYGYADRERNLLMDENSIHRLFSTTKVIICTAAMLLFERGKFLLNDPLSQYLPEFSEMEVVHTSTSGYAWTKPAQSPILVKDLFAMTSGIPYSDGQSLTAMRLRELQEELGAEGTYTLEQLVQKIAQAPLLFEPGSNWAYGFSHDILARLIEVVSGMSIDEFLRKELFEPLGMKDTGYQFSGDQKSRMVTLYAPDEQGGIKPIPGRNDVAFEPESKFYGGGSGLFSTPKDYTQFAKMLANGGKHEGTQIIGRKTIDLLRANQLTEHQLAQFHNPYSEGYGYGLGVRTLMNIGASNGNSSLGEFGWTGMTGTYVVIDPEEQLSIVYMHQRLPNMEREHHLRVRNTVYGCIE